MKLYVVRHGEAEYNTKGLSNADPSVANNLTKAGVGQAEVLAKKLHNTFFDIVYTSEFPRTKQTAEIINEFHGVPVLVESLINELRIDIEGRPTQEWNKLRFQSDDVWNFSWNNGESLADGLARVEKFVQQLKTSNNDNVLIVTHGFIVLALRAILSDYPIKDKYAMSDPGAEASHTDIIELSL